MAMEVLPPNALEASVRAEIDIQISTAHRFPRSMKEFKSRALDMATIDEETAASCLYSRPVGMKNGKQQFAEGLSVRMAEIVGASFGNLRVGATIIEQTERMVRARGFAHDLETNFAASSEVVEATIKRDGTPYDERMRVVIAKAALAKARRDATFMVVPKALCRPIEEQCRQVAIGDAMTMQKRRDGVMTWIGKLGIEPARVFAALGISGEEDIGQDELATLVGLKTSIKDGDVRLDEAFPIVVPKVSYTKTNSTPPPAPKGKGKAKEETAAPAKATPFEGLRNLMTASKVAEKTVMVYLASQGEMFDSLDDVPVAIIESLIQQWGNIVGQLDKEIF